MNKFYVYHVKSDNDTITNRQHAFVDENHIEAFVTGFFKPSKMKFTGVMVEADSATQASDVFNFPHKHDNSYMMVDEPKAFVDKRLLADLGRATQVLMLQTEIIRAKKSFDNLNGLLSGMVDLLFDLGVAKKGSRQELYEKLKRELEKDYRYNGKAS